MIKGLVYLTIASTLSIGVGKAFGSFDESPNIQFKPILDEQTDSNLDLLIENSEENYSNTLYISGLEAKKTKQVAEDANKNFDLEIQSKLQVDDIPLARNF